MMSTAQNTTKYSDSPKGDLYLIIIPVVIVILLIITCIITILLVLYRNKSKNKCSLGKTDPSACHFSKTERTGEFINKSPHRVYSTIRNEEHICGDNQRDTECIYYEVKEVSTPKKQEFSQIYEEVNIELVNRLQNRSCPHNKATEVDRAQLYCFVETSKKEIQHGNESIANNPEHQSDLEVYAEVGNDVIAISQEFDGEVNEYAVVDNTPKIMNQEENNEVHTNISLENSRMFVEPDSSHIYSVVDKNRTYSTSSGSVSSSI